MLSERVIANRFNDDIVTEEKVKNDTIIMEIENVCGCLLIALKLIYLNVILLS